jgi:hypothetical protein
MNRSELAEWARRRIEEARREAPVRVADGGEAFMLWGTIGSCGYVTVDGDVYLEEDTFDPAPGTFVVHRDERARRRVLTLAVPRYPELAPCLPSRSAGDPACQECSGTGWRAVGPHRILCDKCDGLGWIAELS